MGKPWQHECPSPRLGGTLPQALFFFQKNGPHISGSPERLTTLPQALFFQKNGPHISAIRRVSCGGGGGLWVNQYVLSVEYGNMFP